MLPALWPTWSPQIMGTEGLPERLVTSSHGQVLGPLGLKVDVRVLRVDEPSRTWAWRAKVGPVRLRLEHAVLPSTAASSAGGTTTSLTIHGFTPVVLGYLPLAYLALGKLVTPSDGG